MVQITGKYKWISSWIVMLVLAMTTLGNLERGDLANRFAQFMKDTRVVSSLRHIAHRNNLITPWGLHFSDNRDFEIYFTEMRDQDRFTVYLPMTIDKLEFIYIRLSGQPIGVDLSISYNTFATPIKGKQYPVMVKADPEHVALWVGQKKLDEVSRQSRDYEKLFIKAVNSEFTLRTIRSEGGSNHFEYAFSLPVWRPFWKWCSGILLATLMLGAVVVETWKKNRTVFSATGFVAFCFTPLWGATILPLPVSTFPLFLIFLAISILPPVFNWWVKVSDGVKTVWIIATPIVSVASVALACFSRLGYTAGCTAVIWGVAAIGFCAWSFRRAFDGRWVKGLAKMAPALAPGTLGIVFLETMSGNGRSITLALALASAIMLLILVFSNRQLIKNYTALTLVLFITVLGTAELVARSSTDESQMRPFNTGENFVSDDLLFYVPGELFSNGGSFDVKKLQFRSGAATLIPAEGIYRIMLMGGSTTYGDGIDTSDQTHPGRLETCLNQKAGSEKFEVINAGVKGYNLFQLRLLLADYGLDYRPDMMIFYTNTQDTTSVRGPYTYKELWEMKNRGHLDALLKKDEKRAEIKPAPGWVTSVQSVMGRFRLYNLFVKKTAKARQGTLAPLSERFGVLKDVYPFEDYAESLQAVITLCREKKIKLVLVDEFQLDYSAIENPKSARVRNFMKETAAKNSVPFLGLNEEFNEREDSETLVFTHDRVHPSYKGHEEIGKRICEFLLENKLVDEKR